MKWQSLPTLAVAAMLCASCTDSPTRPAPVQQKPKPSEKPSTKPTVNPATKPSPKMGEITRVDMARLYSMHDNGEVLLIDCRPPLYYRLGHIDRAVNLPLKKFDSVFPSKKNQFDQALKAKKVIVLYCQNLQCPDAYAVAKKLAAKGYSTSLFKEGWEGWKQTFGQ